MSNSSLIDFCVPIAPRTKKNSQRIIICRSRPMIIPSSAYKQYEKDCRIFMPKINEPIDYPINLKCVFYMPTRRRVDLTNLQEAICDILVKYKIIADDNRNIIATMDGSMVLYDKDNPRTEIEIKKLDNYQQW